MDGLVGGKLVGDVLGGHVVGWLIDMDCISIPWYVADSQLSTTYFFGTMDGWIGRSELSM